MAICKFTLAVDRDGKDKGADFIGVTVFDRQAENVSKYLSKGRQAAVRGRIQTGSYKNRDGQTVYTTDVVADRVEFLGSAGGENSASNGRNPQNGRTTQAQNNAPQNGDFGGFTTMDEDVPWS